MDNNQRRDTFDIKSRDNRQPHYCSVCSCSCCESTSLPRVRRRCRSEDPERPYGSLHPEAWPTPHHLLLNDNFSISKFPERRLPICPSVPHAKLEAIRDSYNMNNCNIVHGGDYVTSFSKSNGRLSPYKLKHSSVSRNSDMSNKWCESQNGFKFIENEEPRLFTVDEYQEKYGENLDDRPRSVGLNQQKKCLKQMLNNRRSVSPSCFRKCKGRPPPEWPECCEGVSRRTRALSESEKNGCASDNKHYQEDCCSTVINNGRENKSFSNNTDVPQGYISQKNMCSNNVDLQCKNMSEVNLGSWSNFNAESLSKRSVKCGSSKPIFLNKKHPSVKIKSRLLAIKAKRAMMETYSTGSDISEDFSYSSELSDNEDAASKVSLDRDSDMSVEPVDHQECLTSDSGPSVSSVSDSSSLNGLTSALITGAVVTPNDDFSSILRPSLFPHVPPYLRFVSHDSDPLRPPSPVQRHLRWKHTTITPVVVRKTILNSGFKFVRSDSITPGESIDWVGTWGKHKKSVCFKGLRESQKVNHFPGTFHIGRKDRLWKNLQKLMNKFGSKEFGLMPKTYCLPHDLKALKYDWEKYAALNHKWIIKPPASARGTGIKVVARWTQIPKRRPVVVQHYIARPYLINDSKFDMRLYVVVTSIHPLRIYLYPDGLARFASVKYSEENNSLQDRYMHLTNYSINRLSKSYTHNQDASACQGHKWTLRALMNYLKTERGVNTTQLWSSMKDLVIKTILSGESSISCLTKANIGSRYNVYELFGIDVLLDENLKPWLLEVNISPSLHSASPLDLHVKGPLVSLLLNMAQYHVPAKVNMEELQKEKTLGPVLHDKRLYTVHLSKEEKTKHSHFTELENRNDYLDDILTNLTPDDVRHLIQYEDELTQKGTFEKIFPTAKTYSYLEFLAGPRYYNRLFDAWECKYSSNRKAGIKRLQQLCEQGVHLEVPPMPTKNDNEESDEVSLSMQEDSRTAAATTEEAVPKNDTEEKVSPVTHECSLEGRHIVGELCLVCRPAMTLLMQSEGQPLPVQQHA